MAGRGLLELADFSLQPPDVALVVGLELPQLRVHALNVALEVDDLFVQGADLALDVGRGSIIVFLDQRLEREELLVEPSSACRYIARHFRHAFLRLVQLCCQSANLGVHVFEQLVLPLFVLR